MRLSPPQVVERADPRAAVEAMRLRDKVAAREEQARRAQRTAAEAQEAVGRESAINQVLRTYIYGCGHARTSGRVWLHTSVASPVGCLVRIIGTTAVLFVTAGDVSTCHDAGSSYLSQCKPQPFTQPAHATSFLFSFGAPLQGLQQDIDNARHRLLTVQGSLAEACEENAGLKRELEGERIKAAAGSRRLADTVERQEDALAKIRLDSVQLREQRDRRGSPGRCAARRQGSLARKQKRRLGPPDE